MVFLFVTFSFVYLSLAFFSFSVVNCVEYALCCRILHFKTSIFLKMVLSTNCLPIMLTRACVCNEHIRMRQRVPYIIISYAYNDYLHENRWILLFSSLILLKQKYSTKVEKNTLNTDCTECANNRTESNVVKSRRSLTKLCGFISI